MQVKEKCIYKEPIKKDFIKELAYNFEQCDIQYILQGDTVKSYAKKVTDTVQKDGVALEIEEFIL